MFFVLRLVFWLLLICLLLPGGREDNRRLMSSASKAFADMAGFCGRNPDVCEDARHAATAMLARVKSSTELVQGWMAEQGRGVEQTADYHPIDPTGSGRAWYNGGYASPSGEQPAPATVQKGVPQWNNSLNSTDRQLPWRGPDRL